MDINSGFRTANSVFFASKSLKQGGLIMIFQIGTNFNYKLRDKNDLKIKIPTQLN